MKLAALFIIIALLSGCSAASISNNKAADSSEYNSMPPLASAGADQAVAPATLVTLEGRGSYHPGGSQINLRWQQVLKGDEPVVMLSSAFSSSPTFLAPLDECVLTFTLEAGDGRHCTYDEVQVVVTNDTEKHGVGPIVLAGADRVVPPGTEPGAGDISLNSGNARFARVKVSDCSLQANEASANEWQGDFSIWALTGSDNGLASAPDYLLLFDENKYFNMAPLPEITDVVNVTQPRPGQKQVLDVTLSQKLSNYQYLRWQQLRGAALDVVVDGTSMSFNMPMEVQQLAFMVVVSDGQRESAPYLYKINVSPAADNRVPLPVVPARLKGHINQMVAIDGGGSYDFDGDSLTFAWQQLWGAPVELISSSYQPVLYFVAPENPATLVFKLKVCDYQICAESAAVLVDIVALTDNNPPLADNTKPIIVPQNDDQVIIIRFVDPEQDAVSHLSCEFYGPMLPYMQVPASCNEEVNDGVTEISCLFWQSASANSLTPGDGAIDGASDGDGESDADSDAVGDGNNDGNSDGNSDYSPDFGDGASDWSDEYLLGNYTLELNFNFAALNDAASDGMAEPMDTSVLLCHVCDLYDSCFDYAFNIIPEP